MTIFDVASKAGVSKSTVSRVFNNSYRGDPKVAEAVRKIGAELGYNSYKSNSRGRPRLNTGCIRIGSIALLIPDSNEVAMRTVLSECLVQGREPRPHTEKDQHDLHKPHASPETSSF